jgi:hypothetical protein
MVYGMSISFEGCGGSRIVHGYDTKPITVQEFLRFVSGGCGLHSLEVGVHCKICGVGELKIERD